MGMMIMAVVSALFFVWPYTIARAMETQSSKGLVRKSEENNGHASVSVSASGEIEIGSMTKDSDEMVRKSPKATVRDSKHGSIEVTSDAQVVGLHDSSDQIPHESDEQGESDEGESDEQGESDDSDEGNATEKTLGKGKICSDLVAFVNQKLSALGNVDKSRNPKSNCGFQLRLHTDGLERLHMPEGYQEGATSRTCTLSLTVPTVHVAVDAEFKPKDKCKWWVKKGVRKGLQALCKNEKETDTLGVDQEIKEFTVTYKVHIGWGNGFDIDPHFKTSGSAGGGKLTCFCGEVCSSPSECQRKEVKCPSRTFTESVDSFDNQEVHDVLTNVVDAAASEVESDMTNEPVEEP